MSKIHYLCLSLGFHYLVFLYFKDTFQSTHPCGVRPLAFPLLQLVLTSFNPRTRVGCDASCSFSCRCFISFQSTHPCRVRLPAAAPMTKTIMFQSTHPCRVRLPLGITITSSDTGFNPRTRVGCDGQSDGINRVYSGFNPRTRVGCDTSGVIPSGDNGKFQSTHPCRVRRNP